jgi:hypothetical protein
MMMISQLYQVERAKSVAEQRAADARRGEFAAAVSRFVRPAGQRARALAGLRLRFSRAERRAASCPSQLRPAG